MKHILRSLLLSLSLLSISICEAQEEPIELAPFVVSADDGLDTEDFMLKVMADSSFYQAFINLKYIPHSYVSTLFVNNKGEKEVGKQTRFAVQELVTEQRVVDIQEETTNGKLYKRNGSHKYLTAEMYDEVFYPTEPEKVYPHITRFEQDEEKGTKIDKYKSQLKKMMFNPGQEIVSVPFIGGKMDLFNPDMAPLYDFSIYSDYSDDSVYCYVFNVEAKPEARSNKTVIKRMVSYFDKETMQVVMREYRLVNRTLLFQFDIWMRVDNELRAGVLLPKRIQYKGDWDIPFKSPEIIRFDIRCRDYDCSVLD
jgi:hypothetical protein